MLSAPNSSKKRDTVRGMVERNDGMDKLDWAILRPCLSVNTTAKSLASRTSVENDVLGVFTDGDLARALDQAIDIQKQPVNDLMTQPCTTVSPDLLATQALHIMETKKINALPVVDSQNRLIGAFNMHDLLTAGVL